MENKELLDGHDEFSIHCLLEERGLEWVLQQIIRWNNRDEEKVKKIVEKSLKKMASDSETFNELI